MVDIQPNQWYNVGQLFGDELRLVDRLREAKSMPEQFFISAKMMYSRRALFKGGSLSLDFENAWTKIGDLTNCNDVGEMKVYYPLDTPKESDIARVSDDAQLLGKNFKRFVVVIESITREDLLEVPTSYSGLEYTYKIFLRSASGTYLSRATVHDEVDIGNAYVARFDIWTPIDFDETGFLHVPMDSRKLSQLEIKLQELNGFDLAHRQA